MNIIFATSADAAGIVSTATTTFDLVQFFVITAVLFFMTIKIMKWIRG